MTAATRCFDLATVEAALESFRWVPGLPVVVTFEHPPSPKSSYPRLRFTEAGVQRFLAHLVKIADEAVAA